MMSDESVNMFEFSSGLPLEGQRCHSTASVFTYDQQYNADAVVLKIHFQPVDDEGNPEGEAKDQLYSVGKQWEPIAEGEAVANKSGKKQQFNNMTVISKLINSVMVARGGGDVAKGMQVLIDEGVEPDTAAFYLGWDVTLGSIPYKDQNDKDRSTFGVKEWHGRVGEAPKAAKPAAKKLADKPGTAKPAAKPAATDDGDEEEAWAEHFGQALYRKLKKAAVDADDHDAFMNVAFDLDGVVSDDKAWNKKAEQIIMDENGLYASARA